MKRILLLVCCLWVWKAQGQGYNNHTTFTSLEWDNDFHASRNKTDQNYTNGIRATVLHSGRIAQNRWFFNWVLFNTRKQTHCMNGFQLGQDMFTPSDLAETDPRKMDRPYAGYTFLKFQRVSASRTNGTRIYSSNSVGLFGRSSRADRVQKFIHNDLDLGKPPLGWEAGTLRTELILLDYQFMYEGRLLAGLYEKIRGLAFSNGPAHHTNTPIHPNFDIISSIYARVGQVKNEVGFALLTKMGWFNNHFLSTLPMYENDNRYRYRLDRQTSLNTHQGRVYSNWRQNTELGRFRPHQIYFFARPSFTLVASNSFLQGGLLNTLGSTGEPVPIISNNELNRYLPGLDYGVVIAFGWFNFSYSTCYRYPEFRDGTPHKWGQMSLSVLY
jgi:hypothetical protein